MENMHDRIERERKAAQPNAADLQEFRQYAEGDQKSTLGAEQKRALGQVANHAFADNICDLVLNAAASRLELTEFAVEREAVAEFLDNLYVRNQLADLSYDIHYAALRDGMTAVALRWMPDDVPPDAADQPETSIPLGRVAGRVTLHAEDWWDGKSGVFVAYDDAGQPIYAVKDFAQMVGDPPVERARRTIYFPDHLERWIKEGNGWRPFPLAGEPATGVVPWRKRDGSPLGIPVVAFGNARFGRRRYGASDLAGGLLALQDQLNDIHWDVTAAARLTGYQMYFARGMTAEKNADGTPKKLRVGPGQVVESANADADMKVLPAGDMSQLIDAHGLKLQTAARNTSTPIHIITGGDWPAGIALVQAEKPLIAKVQRLAKTVGPAWSTVAHRATELANAFGGLALDEDALITAVFAAPERLDPLAQAEAEEMRTKALIGRETLQDRQSLLDLGLTEQSADDILRRREAGQRARDELLSGVPEGDDDVG